MNRYIWKIKHGDKTWECQDIDMDRTRSMLQDETRLKLLRVQGHQGLEEIVIRFRPNDAINIERATVSAPEQQP